MPKFVYITCPVTKSKNKLKLMEKVSDLVEYFGYVPLKPDTKLSAKSLFKRDVNCLSKSSLIISEYTSPSHGVGFETGFAFVKNIPLIGLIEKGSKISRIIKGNSKIQLIEYSSERDAIQKLKSVLSKRI